MKRVIILLLCTILVLGVFSGCAGNKAFSVGYARADINPESGVPLAGFGDGNTRFSGQVLDDLYATCVACTDTKGNTVLMYGMDLLNIRGSVFDVIRTNIEKETGVPYENIMFFGSHTHSAPEMDTSFGMSVTKYIELLGERCLQAAKDALADRSPAKMYATFARPERLNFVRHYVLSNGEYRGFRVWEYKDGYIGHPHKADNLLQLVKFTREQGKDVILVNWQAHYAGADDVDYNGISSDYAGVLRRELEKALDCHASFYQGGGGNLSSGSRIKGESASESYTQTGEMLAQYAIDVAGNFKELALGDIQVQEEIFQIGKMQGPVLYALSFGDFACVFAPFEVFDNNAKNVREASKFKYTFYASCANAGWSNRYLPDAEAYRYPTYESCGHGLPTFNYAVVPKGSAELLEAQFTRMLDDLFTASGNDVKEKDEGYLTPEFVPVCDGAEYINPTPGDMTQCTEGEGGNGLYCLNLLKNNNMTKMLAADKETAELVLSKSTMKLLFDERNVIVGIAE